MKNHELLDMIGDVNEDYVREAEVDAARPHSHWKRWAACAACAALLAAAYPVSRMFLPAPTPDPVPAPAESRAPDRTLIQIPGLHPYTLVEDDRSVVSTVGDKAAQPFIPYAPGAGTEDSQAPAVPSPPAYGEQSGDVPVQEEASSQYDNLLQWMVGTMTPERYPEWYAGAWLDWPGNTARLAIGIVEEFRTPGLEAQIKAWCGGTGEIVFVSAKYSENHLNGLMPEIARVFDELNCNIYLSYGPDVIENRIRLDFFEEPGEDVLAALAELDPEGDAIFIQVFVGARIALTGAAVKGPAPGAVEPFEFSVPDEERTEPGPEAVPTPVPGGAQSAEELPEVIETEQPAYYDLLPHNE